MGASKAIPNSEVYDLYYACSVLSVLVLLLIPLVSFRSF